MANSTPENDKTFFENIKKLCAARGISVTALGDELGLSSATTSGWRKGSQPRSKTLKMIADYFDVTVDQLIDRPMVNITDKHGDAHAPVTTNDNQGLSMQELELIEIYRSFPLEKQLKLLSFAFELKKENQ